MSARGPAVGSIALILGPMFSGKTSELMRRVRSCPAALANDPVIIQDHDPLLGSPPLPPPCSPPDLAHSTLAAIPLV